MEEACGIMNRKYPIPKKYEWVAAAAELLGDPHVSLVDGELVAGWNYRESALPPVGCLDFYCDRHWQLFIIYDSNGRIFSTGSGWSKYHDSG